MSNSLGSAFNFFSPFDDVLPEPTSDLSTTAVQQQLWGLYFEIATDRFALVPYCVKVVLKLDPTVQLTSDPTARLKLEPVVQLKSDQHTVLFCG